MAGFGCARDLNRPSRLRQQPPPFFEQGVTGRCEFDPAARALEEGDAELLFEPAHLVAEGGLGDVEARGSPAEMKFFSYSDEVFDLSEVEPFDRRNLSIRGQFVLDFAVADRNTRPAANDPRRNRWRPL